MPGNSCLSRFGSVTQSSPTLCDPMNQSQASLCQASLSITNSWSLLKLMPMESVMPSSHFILCRPLLLLPSVPPRIRVFSSESTLHMRWLKYRSFSFSISPSNEHPGLISFRMDWLDLLACLLISKNGVYRAKSEFSVHGWDLSAVYLTTGVFGSSSIHNFSFSVLGWSDTPKGSFMLLST